ncbi:sensor histidine kinase [Actinospica sp. MGRD01-02]|uniref:histidine kinase n=1 Tax=Actinospica acidithermotolerans TaxID=2828514 RepID=A0A941EG91_9ACTN|nr:sensor histidine kinase [Actinospica acidithermotolerans]MBR7830897.1 sensor histidine kinase [Actinospica acidithermotolerans]
MRTADPLASTPPGTVPFGLFGRVMRGLGIALLLAALALDLHSVPDWHAVDGPATALVSTAAVCALLWPARLRPASLTPALRAAIPALLTIAINVALRASGSPVGFAERPGLLAALLCLLIVALRGCANPWHAAACVAALCGALASIPLTADDLGSSDQAGSLTVLTLLASGFVGLGAFLRSSDTRHRAAVRQVQLGERLAIAADLHDFVAHHVTGILVQTQVARLMATADAPRLDPVLADVEQAAGEALASMRRLVGVLRTGDDEDDGQRPAPAAELRPTGDLAQLTRTVDTFSRVGPRAILRRDPAVTEDLPHVIQSAAFRIVQESLTNVRRHAADTTEVLVELDVADGALEVRVTDDGGGSTPSPAALRGGGFGLIGLRERVTALGGEIMTGPAEHGWRVRARLPLDRPGQHRTKKTGTGKPFDA